MAFGYKPRDRIPLDRNVLIAPDYPIVIGLHTQIAEGTTRMPVLDSLTQVTVDPKIQKAQG